jgi:GT2 family glycosyltransferase
LCSTTGAELPGYRFSLIIPCVSDAETLRQTLAGIGAQTYDPSGVQVIVVDDASEPPLKSIVCDFASSSPVDVTYLRNPINRGRAATRNTGIEVSSGEILLFMDVDQLLATDCLEHLDKGFSSSLNQSIRVNTSVWPPLLERSAFLRYYDSRFLGRRPDDQVEQLPLHDLPPRYYATTCIATGRNAVQSVGGFDETFARYGCEDEDLGIRLNQADVPLRLCLEARSYSTDGSLTVGRACRRLIDYAGISVPLLLKKHPQYRAQLTLGILERGMLAAALSAVYRPAFANALLKYLDRRDAEAGFRPSPRLHQLALLGFYLQGIRSRPQSGERQ